MIPKLLAKCFDHPESLTQNEVGMLAKEYGDIFAAAAGERRAEAVMRAAITPPTPAPPPTDRAEAHAQMIFECVTHGVTQMCTPLVQRIKTLEAEARALNDRLLSLEADKAAVPPRVQR